MNNKACLLTVVFYDCYFLPGSFNYCKKYWLGGLYFNYLKLNFETSGFMEFSKLDTWVCMMNFN